MLLFLKCFKSLWEVLWEKHHIDLQNFTLFKSNDDTGKQIAEINFESHEN